MSSSSIAHPVDNRSSDSTLTPGSVTHLIKGLRDGDELAVTKLWDLYFARIVKLASKQLGNTYRADYDEEDVAISAFKSVFLFVEKKPASYDFDRDEFWKIVATITLRKVYDAIAHSRRQKRNPLNSPGGQRLTLEHAEVANFLLSDELHPGLSAEVEEYFGQMLNALPKDEFRMIVAWKLEGYTNREIAAKLNRGLSSIERKLKTIRQVWRDALLI